MTALKLCLCGIWTCELRRIVSARLCRSSRGMATAVTTSASGSRRQRSAADGVEGAVAAVRPRAPDSALPP